MVKLATDKQSGLEVAVKIITVTNLSEEDMQAVHDEIEVLRLLHHPSIIRLFDHFEEEEYCYIVTEYLAGGELFDRIVKKTFYSEHEARDVVYTLLSTVKFCHDLGIVHRDIKPENLLLTSPDEDAHVKLADFGMAVRHTGEPSLTQRCGTPGYVAPEILLGLPYGKAVDMWSVGVVTYILLGGYPPFHDEKQSKLFKKIKKGEYEFHPEFWSAVSEEAKDLIRKLLTLNPTDRLTADQALQHSWVSYTKLSDIIFLTAVNYLVVALYSDHSFSPGLRVLIVPIPVVIVSLHLNSIESVHRYLVYMIPGYFNIIHRLYHPSFLGACVTTFISENGCNSGRLHIRFM